MAPGDLLMDVLTRTQGHKSRGNIHENLTGPLRAPWLVRVRQRGLASAVGLWAKLTQFTNASAAARWTLLIYLIASLLHEVTRQATWLVRHGQPLVAVLLAGALGFALAEFLRTDKGAA